MSRTAHEYRGVYEEWAKGGVGEFSHAHIEAERNAKKLQRVRRAHRGPELARPGLSPPSKMKLAEAESEGGGEV